MDRGSAIAKIVAENTKANPDVFHEEVKMFVALGLFFFLFSLVYDRSTE